MDLSDVIPLFFVAINCDGDEVPISVDPGGKFRFFEVDDMPIAFIPTEGGGLASVLFADPPRLYGLSRITYEGTELSEQEFE